MKIIVQIAVHMGAGAGKAISGLALLDKINRHRIILLDKPQKFNHIDKCRESGVDVIICPNWHLYQEMIRQADVVIVNWWHHPLVYKALIDIRDIPVRLMIWGHVNGINYPVMSSRFLQEFEACLFTSEASFENSFWEGNKANEIREKSELVYGMGDFIPELFKSKDSYEIQESIRIGYIGSLDYAKLNPEFIQWLKLAVKDNRKIIFEIAGDTTPEVERDIEDAQISQCVHLLGYRNDIQELLVSWDIFVYPLAHGNFATTENALIEAMACGLPIIAGDSEIEKSIIDDKVTGLIISDSNGFLKAIQDLISDEELRRSLGISARTAAIKKYDINSNLMRFHSVVEKTLKVEKNTHDFTAEIGEEPFEWFLSGCESERKEGIMQILELAKRNDKKKDLKVRVNSLGKIMLGKEKGSVGQFARCYPEDERLKALSDIINNFTKADL